MTAADLIGKALSFAAPDFPEGIQELREEVRAFLADERASGRIGVGVDAWLGGHDPEFSKRLAERGWIGMTWPKRYGGSERSMLERYVVIEELLAAGAPVAAHWVADRQTGPLLLRYGTEAQRERFLPAFASGECYVAIGMSEPDAGSDLASVRTHARRRDSGWVLNGTKIWTSNAHRSHYAVVLCRTSERHEDRHAGLSQLIVDLGGTGVSVLPILGMAGEHHFNEVVFDDVYVPDDMMVGNEGDGWHQVVSELGFERSGPERFLSTFGLLVEVVRNLEGSSGEVVELGRLVAQLAALRRMSLAVAGRLEAGDSPDVAAALVKDLGTRLELEVIELARHTARREPRLHADDALTSMLAQAILAAPGFPLRGGTNEILRGIVASALGAR